MKATKWAVLAALVGGLGKTCPAYGADYLITDLGALPGGNASQALDINNNGQVVGSSATSGGSIRHAFLWTAAGGMIDLGTLGEGHSSASSINRSGQVVGWVSTTDDTPQNLHPFLWTPGLGMQQLGTDPGQSQALCINDSGQVGGVNVGVACLWDVGGGAQSLGTLPGTSYSGAFGVNNSGQVVGDSFFAGDRGFLWSPATGLTDLGSLGGTGCEARAINNLGQVVGGSQLADGNYHAFLWTAESGMRDLGTVGTFSSGATAINESGDVVGELLTNTGQPKGAFLWTADGGMRDLNGLIDPNEHWTLSLAHGINDLGQIVGYGTNPAGQQHAFLLTPVPEPGAVMLLALGLPGLMRRRKR